VGDARLRDVVDTNLKKISRDFLEKKISAKFSWGNQEWDAH
jgi:hypothetical protein